MFSSLKVISFVSYKRALSALISTDKHSTLAFEAMLTRASLAPEAMLIRAFVAILCSFAVSSNWSNKFLNLELSCNVVIATTGRAGLSSSSSPRSAQITTTTTHFPLWFRIGFLRTSGWHNSRVPSLIMWCTTLQSAQHSTIGCCTWLCKRWKHRSLHSSLVGSLETWLGLKTPSAIHLSGSTSNSFGVLGNGLWVSHSLPSDFLFLSPVDTAMACKVDLHPLGLSKLGLTDWRSSQLSAAIMQTGRFLSSPK